MPTTQLSRDLWWFGSGGWYFRTYGHRVLSISHHSTKWPTTIDNTNPAITRNTFLSFRCQLSAKRIICRSRQPVCDASHRDSLPPAFPPSRPHKVAHAEVAEQRQHRHRAHQLLSFRRARMPLSAQADHRSQEKQREQAEKEAG